MRLTPARPAVQLEPASCLAVVVLALFRRPVCPLAEVVHQEASRRAARAAPVDCIVVAGDMPVLVQTVAVASEFPRHSSEQVGGEHQALVGVDMAAHAAAAFARIAAGQVAEADWEPDFLDCRNVTLAVRMLVPAVEPEQAALLFPQARLKRAQVVAACFLVPVAEEPAGYRFDQLSRSGHRTNLVLGLLDLWPEFEGELGAQTWRENPRFEAAGGSLVLAEGSEQAPDRSLQLRLCRLQPGAFCWALVASCFEQLPVLL